MCVTNQRQNLMYVKLGTKMGCWILKAEILNSLFSSVSVSKDTYYIPVLQDRVNDELKDRVVIKENVEQ